MRWCFNSGTRLRTLWQNWQVVSPVCTENELKPLAIIEKEVSEKLVNCSRLSLYDSIEWIQLQNLAILAYLETGTYYFVTECTL
jgi:hypothetical protein